MVGSIGIYIGVCVQAHIDKTVGIYVCIGIGFHTDIGANILLSIDIAVGIAIIAGVGYAVSIGNDNVDAIDISNATVDAISYSIDNRVAVGLTVIVALDWLVFII